MSTKNWRWPIVCVAMARLVMSQADAAPVTIGIPLPHGQVQGDEMAESMRQSLISQLKAQSIDAVSLSASTGGLETEVQAKHCNYVLYRRVQNKHSTGSGMFGKLSMLTHGISPNGIGAGDGSIKRGDTVVLDYRLMAMGSSDPIKADSLSAKADSDGQDVVSPLVAQLTNAVAAAAQGKDQGEALAQASPQTSTQAVPAPASDAHPSSNGSRFGGFFGHRSISSAKSTGGNMSTTKEEQKIIKKEEAILAKRQAEAQAAVGAATAADTATEIATAGLVQGHALNAVEKTLDAQDKAEKERVMREDLPTYQKMISQTADLGSDFGQQLQANPRLGRLMHLADSKHCKGGG
jgi:hypothetical protein